MPKPRLIIERTPAPLWVNGLIPVLVLLVTFLLTAGVIALSGANPLEVYRYMLIEPLSNKVGVLEVLVKAIPMILCGIAVSFAFSAGYYTIGIEGQLYAGAIAAAWLGTVLGGLPPLLAIPLMMLGGFAAGMAWAFLPAILRIKLGVDEVVTTLLLNPVMVFVLDALLGGPWRNPTTSQLQSPEIAVSTRLPRLVPRSRLHLGLVIALVAAVVLWYVLSRTAFGLKLRAAGLGRDAARFMGVKVSRVMLICALISGGIAGIAGVCEIAGIHYHIIPGFSPGYGYSGVIVAMLGGLNPLGIVVAGLFFGLIDTGAQTVASSLGVPVYLGQVTQATMLLVTLAMLLLRNYRIRRA